MVSTVSTSTRASWHGHFHTANAISIPLDSNVQSGGGFLAHVCVTRYQNQRNRLNSGSSTTMPAVGISNSGDYDPTTWRTELKLCASKLFVSEGGAMELAIIPRSSSGKAEWNLALASEWLTEMQVIHKKLLSIKHLKYKLVLMYIFSLGAVCPERLNKQ